MHSGECLPDTCALCVRNLAPEPEPVALAAEAEPEALAEEAQPEAPAAEAPVVELGLTPAPPAGFSGDIRL